MANEVFEAVRAAEEKANAIIGEAQHAARDVLKDAQTACAENERSIAQAQRTLYQGKLEEKRAQVRRAIETGREARVREQDALLQKARGLLDAAADSLYERVISDGDR